MTSVLDVRDLRVHFDGVVAVDGVSFSLDPGAKVGLIGPNGAGKTTVLDALSGFVGYAGSVVLRGASLDRLRPDERARRGMARTFQSLELFEDLTVYDNVAMAAVDLDAVRATLAAFQLVAVAHEVPGSLPAPTRRWVALARAVVAEPKVLLLDEVAAGMDASQRDTVRRHLDDRASAGTAVLLIDHDLGFVSDVCEHIVVLNAGRVLASGAPAEMRRDNRVIAAYLGRAG